jgi:hypothetical protein
MKPSSNSPAAIRCFAAALAGVFAAGGGAEAWACGPFFPNRYLEARTETLLAAPEALFTEELARLLPSGTVWVPEREYRSWASDQEPTGAERTAEADARELGEVLRVGGRANGDAERLTDAYRAARASGAEAPTGTPAEFALYLRGAQAWKRGEKETARVAWRELLALPEEARRHRSVWAAYMLGRSYLVLAREDDGLGDAEARDEATTPAGHVEEAVAWLTMAERLAAEGFSDRTGLAGEAKGWRARLLGEGGDFPGATALYLERLAAGDDTAAQSLRRLARRIVRAALDGDVVERCVRDEKTRGLVVAFLLSRGAPIHGYWSSDSEWPERARVWALAIHRAGATEVAGADRLAWLAYEGGLFELAKEWLRIAPAASPEANWLRSKLALRGGDAAKGAEWLERALSKGGLHESHRNLAWAELGRTRLALDEPQAALVAFLRGGHEEDAAFLGERVLDVDELAILVDGAAGRPGDLDAEANEAEGRGRWIRHLLARRLVRENQGERALGYMCEPERGELGSYLEDYRTGFDSNRPAKERAEALWRAARLMRRSGMGLAGTALEPDWATWGGNFEPGSVAERRLGGSPPEGGVFATTTEEQVRIRKNTTSEKRFHYRYRAAELAWWASSLMPDQAEETARVLWEAGGWLKARDPKAAEPFYRALVLRCGKTALGREAKRLRWFPQAPTDRF